MNGAERGTAVLLNDTSSWYHYGCNCTSLGIHTQLRKTWSSVRSVSLHRIANLAPLPTAIEGFDDAALFSRFAAAHADLLAEVENAAVVYINGEGALHNLGHQALGLLYVAYVTKTQLGRPVHIINHSFFPDDTLTASDNTAFALYRKVYERMDYVAVRERLSAGLLAEIGIPATLSFDCLPLFVRQHFSAEKNPQSRNVVISGSVSWGGANVVPTIGAFVNKVRGAGYVPVVLIGANGYPDAGDIHFVEALNQYSEGRFELVNATSELEWLATIASAALLVSGRFHHSIAAAFVDTPFIVMESNTPKIEGMLAMLESNAFLSAAQPNLDEALYERAQALIANPEDALVRETVKQRLLDLALENFSGPLPGGA